MRLADVFGDLREQAGEPWLLAGPVYDDLMTPQLAIQPSVTGVLASGRWAFMSKTSTVFFSATVTQFRATVRLAITAPCAPAKNHASSLAATSMRSPPTSDVLASSRRVRPSSMANGNRPKAVFQMGQGRSHWYRGFVSPNNICGKLKFFSVDGLHEADDRSHRAPWRVGDCLHSVWTPNLDGHELAREHDIEVTDIARNEFGEESFVLSGPDGATWRVIGAMRRKTGNAGLSWFRSRTSESRTDHHPSSHRWWNMHAQ